MATALKKPEPMTIEAFDAFVDTQPEVCSYELVDGVIVMMSNPTEIHEEIVGNIAAPLKVAMTKRNCRTFIGGMRVQISDKRDGIDKTKPDIVVRCGSAATSSTFIIDPIVVVEVLSPSTIDFDRGAKLDFYKLLPTTMHIVLVYQDQMRVEHYRRTDRGFELEVLKAPSDTLELETVAFKLDLEHVYAGVEV
jgi:Uma2 family endonuclease